MKFVTFKIAENCNVGVILQDESEIVAISSVLGYENCDNMIKLIEKMGVDSFSSLEKSIENSKNLVKHKLSDVQLLSPIPRPIHDIVCVGVNYSDHYTECQAEMPMEKPQDAIYFSKRSNKILSATDDILHTKKVDETLDYEVELAVIIGKNCIDVKACDAENYIFGYSVFNDLSARNLQKKHNQWYKGKGLDNTSVMGPYIVAKNEIEFPPHLDISCSVNGEIRQNSNTKMYIHDISKMIEELSAGCTLEAGDILITGTPAGVGMGFNPPNYLKVGDIVECKIEKIGAHKNKIV